jgi:hypothetical protein
VAAGAAPLAGAPAPVATSSKSALPLFLALGALAVVAGAAVLAFLLLRQGVAGPGPAVAAASIGGAKGATVAEVVKADLSATPEQMAKRFAVTVTNGHVRVPLSGARFESISFFWDATHLEHVNMVMLQTLASGMPADVVPRVQAQLGRAFTTPGSGGHAFVGNGVALSVSSGFYINAHRFDEPHWKTRLNALFTVLKGAGLGTSDVIDEKTKRDVLNLDYPLARLAEVDFDLPVENAERELHRVIPGAVSAGERHDVGLGHPWFVSSMLFWENQPRGRFLRVYLAHARSFDFKAQREDLQRCVKPALGEPKVDVTNHLAGEVSLSYRGGPKDAQVHVTSQNVIINAAEGNVRESVRKVLLALATCG